MNTVKTLMLSIVLPFAGYGMISGMNENMRSVLKFQKKKSDIIADNAKPVLISSQFKFTEGPVADKQGNFFFTDIIEDKIWKYSIEGELSLFMDKTGHSDGMYFDKKGNLITAADEKNELWSISPDKKITVILDNYEGKRFNGPNDLWIDKKGGIYFTDPYYQRPYWERKQSELDGQHVYYLPNGSKKAIIVDNKLVMPNGIIGSADGKNLFVADIGDKKTYKYTINKDGSLSERKLFTGMGSDGMTLDNKSNLYLTGRGVTVFNPRGEQIEHIELPGWTANVTFGGKNKDILFITSNKSVYTLKMKVKGI
ncbi:SMP-30/gluconolactonase/LRE family protein [Daejeonella sp. H1SJ63]|uniref:SMP-30/gluconolactonase/LRE family protein n=1 Tax=Daejeonella sp. H1SJ63 TaxID=3034145 RepID=UPI0023EAEEFD|nr:SMP-30/gluconolactonase/LRE family protein [Daejeonella sp. H1SJ63]